MTSSLTPTRDELDRVFRQKHGDPETTGWSPRRRYRFGYFTPDDVYEAIVAKLVSPETDWLDVGGGRDLFPHNVPLARELASRCRCLVGVDPSANVHENPFVHEKVQAPIENYPTDRTFDLATLRMVAEHVTSPDAVIAKFAALVRPGGKVVIYTVNRWAPITVVSSLIPFGLHHPIKRLVWGTDEKDTFPVVYKMNTRSRLRSLFGRHGFREVHFAHLDDCRAFANFWLLNLVEMWTWRGLRAVGLCYPETCLLGVYERTA